MAGEIPQSIIDALTARGMRAYGGNIRLGPVQAPSASAGAGVDASAGAVSGAASALGARATNGDTPVAVAGADNAAAAQNTLAQDSSFDPTLLLGAGGAAAAAYAAYRALRNRKGAAPNQVPPGVMGADDIQDAVWWPVDDRSLEGPEGVKGALTAREQQLLTGPEGQTRVEGRGTPALEKPSRKNRPPVKKYGPPSKPPKYSKVPEDHPAHPNQVAARDADNEVSRAMRQRAGGMRPEPLDAGVARTFGIDSEVAKVLRNNPGLVRTLTRIP